MSVVWIHMISLCSGSNFLNQVQSLESTPQSDSRFRGTRTSIGIRKSKSTKIVAKLKSSEQRRRHAGIPKRVLNELAKAGANVTKCPGEGLYLIQNIHFGDSAWKIFEKFAESAPSDPCISVGFCPSVETWIIPEDDLSTGIVIEAKSIRTHYSKLDVSAFAGGVVPAIPGPKMYPMLQRFQSPKLALSKLFERIQNPNHAEYPVLTGLPSGSYICSIAHQWDNAALDITVFKP